METMVRYEISIIGTMPLLWNRMKLELQDEIKQLKKNEISEWEMNRDNWIRKAEFKGDNGHIPKDNEDVYIPEVWIRGSIVEACKHSKLIPHFATKKNETYTRYIESCFIESDNPVCKAEDLKGFGSFVSSQGVKGGGKVYRIRPTIPEWKHKFIFVDIFGRMKKSEIEEIFDYAGKIEGIGDGRKIRMGRFEIKSIKKEAN